MTSFVLSLFLVLSCPDIDRIRVGYHQINSESSLEAFISLTKSTRCAQATPYLACAEMMRARYVLNPISKLEHFNRGKSLLESYISQNPGCVEGYYVRALIQSEVPSILGYKENMNADIQFISRNLEASDLPDFYKRIILQNLNKIKS